MGRVLLIGTAETKSAQLDCLADTLRRRGLSAEIVDVSLGSDGAILPGPEKLARMERRAKDAADALAARSASCDVVVGIGGGTGSEIVLNALRGLPAAFPKVLVTTLAFDPRPALADTAIILVPTLCDIEGLNAMLRQAFENTAALVAGLAQAEQVTSSDRPSIAVTTLGATGRGGAEVVRALGAAGCEATVFHANGFGGAAFTRFIGEGKAAGAVDLNVHELNRMRIEGDHVPMPERFTAARNLPRVVLPGALNFLGLNALETVSEAHRARPHYAHSGNFTHVKLTEAEMADQAAALAAALNRSTAPCHVVLPMGGFSHEDRPGGAIEDPALREIAAEALEADARAYTTERLDHHINTPETAAAAVAALTPALSPTHTARTTDA